MTIDRDEEGRDQGTFIYTHKKRFRVSKLNTYKTLRYAVNIFENAFYCTELRTTWPTDSMWNTI